MSDTAMGSTQGAAPPADRHAADDRAGQRTGRDLLFAIHAALRALKLYPLENQTVQTAPTADGGATTKPIGRQ